MFGTSLFFLLVLPFPEIVSPDDPSRVLDLLGNFFLVDFLVRVFSTGETPSLVDFLLVSSLLGETEHCLFGVTNELERFASFLSVISASRRVGRLVASSFSALGLFEAAPSLLERRYFLSFSILGGSSCLISTAEETSANLLGDFLPY